MPEINPIISIDQNHHTSSERVAERSNALCGKAWGRVNSDVGGRTARYDELEFCIGILGNYLKSYFNPEENPVINFAIRAVTGIGDFFGGKRDQEMYGKAYGHGVDELSGLSPEELKNENGIFNRLEKEENRYGDDYIQNKRQEALYGERIISKFAEWSTQLSKIKPIAHFISGVLGDNWRNAVQTILDAPARVWWRLRFFTKALHGNFVTSIWDLTRLKVMSFFSGNASEAYNRKAKDLAEMSNEYFSSKYNKKENNPGLGLYAQMLKDRMLEHWQNIWDPKAALERKCNDKFLQRTTEQERSADPSKTFNNGYVDPNSEYDRKEQSRLAAVDFTGPICAALGLIGTVVFDPLKVIWNFAGFERGKNVINALSASRKSFSLAHYILRFIIPEMSEGATYKDLEKYMNSKEGPKKATAELYYARKSRYYNALIGMVMAAGNICEPLLHLKRGIVGDSKFGNFLIDSIMKFNDTFFLRFFSKRREVQGREQYLQARVKEKLGKQYLENKDYEKISDPEFDNLMKDRTVEVPSSGLGIIDSVTTWAAEKITSVEKTCSGEAGYINHSQAA